eukprot:CAMPEP_0202340808 /NCGR_PEP_ID=MMETSP1126-20121109/2092_1 /ASSEMBLY_ACC=CAM_ASM_000457 /TAXON_ID=3047 /ORGANISM="Dunaliella tertiolecta, Strain CCMP1320" /LENGTH=848 /DNA_ID=CAMNT_0048931573 /DNA_START=11 /DNA_END=2557 /DNA_ORIENTATION=-
MQQQDAAPAAWGQHFGASSKAQPLQLGGGAGNGMQQEDAASRAIAKKPSRLLTLASGQLQAMLTMQRKSPAAPPSTSPHLSARLSKPAQQPEGQQASLSSRASFANLKNNPLSNSVGKKAGAGDNEAVQGVWTRVQSALDAQQVAKATKALQRPGGPEESWQEQGERLVLRTLLRGGVARSRKRTWGQESQEALPLASPPVCTSGPLQLESGAASAHSSHVSFQPGAHPESDASSVRFSSHASLRPEACPESGAAGTRSPRVSFQPGAHPESDASSMRFFSHASLPPEAHPLSGAASEASHHALPPSSSPAKLSGSSVGGGDRVFEDHMAQLSCTLGGQAESLFAGGCLPSMHISSLMSATEQQQLQQAPCQVSYTCTAAAAATAAVRRLITETEQTLAMQSQVQVALQHVQALACSIRALLQSCNQPSQLSRVSSPANQTFPSTRTTTIQGLPALLLPAASLHQRSPRYTATRLSSPTPQQGSPPLFSPAASPHQSSPRYTPTRLSSPAASRQGSPLLLSPGAIPHQGPPRYTAPRLSSPTRLRQSSPFLPMAAIPQHTIPDDEPQAPLVPLASHASLSPNAPASPHSAQHHLIRSRHLSLKHRLTEPGDATSAPPTSKSWQPRAQSAHGDGRPHQDKQARVHQYAWLQQQQQQQQQQHASPHSPLDQQDSGQFQPPPLQQGTPNFTKWASPTNHRARRMSKRVSWPQELTEAACRRSDEEMRACSMEVRPVSRELPPPTLDKQEQTAGPGSSKPVPGTGLPPSGTVVYALPSDTMAAPPAAVPRSGLPLGSRLASSSGALLQTPTCQPPKRPLSAPAPMPLSVILTVDESAEALQDIPGACSMTDA